MTVIQRSILLVDDDKATRRIMSKWLACAGYEVTEAENGEQALKRIAEKCPNFLITDWEMPVMDGLQLCRQVRELSLPHYLYTIIVTDRPSSDGMEIAMETGADDFVSKLVHQNEILARLRAGVRVLDMEQRLNLLANSDPLTGLNTKRIFKQRLDDEWQRATRHDRDLSCVIIDIDFFKRINDTHGHPAGDEVIRTIANLITQHSRASDMVCRYGGEEFCVLLPEADESNATIWAERLREAISQTTIDIGQETLSVTASFGVAQLSDDLSQPDQLIERADQCLLVAKQSGRDCVVDHTKSQQQTLLSQDSSAFQTNCLDHVLARDVMTLIVAGLKEDCTIDCVADYFVNLRINSAPVVDDHGKMVGIVSEKDLMNKMLNPGTWSTPVRELMKTNVVSYEDDTPVSMIYEFLCRVTIRCVMIVRDGSPVGLISRGSLLRWFSNGVMATHDAKCTATTESRPASWEVSQRDGRQLEDTITALVEQSRHLWDDIHNGAVDDLLPKIVGGVSRIQELANDLLAKSRTNYATGITSAIAKSAV